MVTLYVLESRSHGKRYVGITDNLPRRLMEHRKGYTQAGHLLGDFIVIHTEPHPHHAQARVREKFLKSGLGRAWLKAQYPRSWPAKATAGG